MRLWIQILIVFILLSNQCFAANIETIVFIRHGEKPKQDLGQLSCQGLNRSLALPSVLKYKFGIPNDIFAPNPGGQVPIPPDHYYYVRALATIEPTAIKFELPLKTPFNYNNNEDMSNLLLSTEYHNALVFVSWEHLNLVVMAKKIMNKLGQDPNVVPSWPGDDFDSIYIIKINWDVEPQKVIFSQDQEGLNYPSKDCPNVYY